MITSLILSYVATVLIESLVAALLNVDLHQNFGRICLVNLCTNPLLVLLVTALRMPALFQASLVSSAGAAPGPHALLAVSALTFFLELAIWLLEACFYERWLIDRRISTERYSAFPWLLSIAANAASWLFGVILNLVF